MFPHEEFFDVLRLHTGPLHRRFAELDCRDIGETAATAAERLPDAAGEVDFLKHYVNAKCVFLLAQVITSRPGRLACRGEIAGTDIPAQQFRTLYPFDSTPSKEIGTREPPFFRPCPASSGFAHTSLKSRSAFGPRYSMNPDIVLE